MHPLFHINAILDMNRVQLKPNIEELTVTIKSVISDVISVIRIVPRMSQLMEKEMGSDIMDSLLRGDTLSETSTSDRRSLNEGSSNIIAIPNVIITPEGGAVAPTSNLSFYDIISGEEEIMKLSNLVTTGIMTHINVSQKYLSHWDRYKHLWDSDKEKSIKRYANFNPTLEEFERDITEKQETQRQIENEETITNSLFLRFDCTMLKYSLISHCNAWQNKYTSLLSTNAFKELSDLHEFFSDSIRHLKVPPRNLEMLKQSITLQSKMQDELPTIEAKFEPLQRQYKALERFEVQVEEQAKLLLEALPGVWNNFRQTLIDTEELIKSKKEHFRSNLLQSADDFGKVVASMREEFLINIPKNSNFVAAKAFAIIADFRKQLNILLEKETKLKQGLTIFQLDAPVYKELTQTSKDIDQIEQVISSDTSHEHHAMMITVMTHAQVWKLKEEWEASWESWKSITFKELNIAQMEDTAQKFQKKIVILGRDIKHLLVWQELKERIDVFKVSMPLIMDLKNPAFRLRHWEQLKIEVGKPFDPESVDFTLQVMTSCDVTQKLKCAGDIRSGTRRICRCCGDSVNIGHEGVSHRGIHS